MNAPRFVCRALAVLVLTGAAAGVSAAEITVSAAASLTNAFRSMGQAYEKQYPDARVNFNFAASGPLLQQLAKGAPVDVLATADQETMDRARQQGLVVADTRQDFARNTLVLVVPADSTLAIRSLHDLARPEVRRVAVGSPASVPVGRYGVMALEQAGEAGVLQGKIIHTQSVRQSLDYVARGEVDAGFVYATDAAIMPGKVRTAMTVPLREPIVYPIAVASASGQQAEARRFVRFVRSPAGQAILGRHGFGQP